MATITISTRGGLRDKECHKAEDISAGMLYDGEINVPNHYVVLNVTPDQAAAVAYDLLYQMVDAGYISGWNVQFPERDEKVPPVVPAYWNAEAQAYEV